LQFAFATVNKRCYNRISNHQTSMTKLVQLEGSPAHYD